MGPMAPWGTDTRQSLSVGLYFGLSRRGCVPMKTMKIIRKNTVPQFRR